MPAPQKHHARNQQSSQTKKASGNVKKAPAKRSAAVELEDRGLSDIPLELQQAVLDIFKSSFPDTFNEDLPEKLQEVKTHLFNRDFLGAFGSDELLAAYAVRWSPSRALAYLSILHGVIGTTLKLKDIRLNSSTATSSGLNICCIGGGAGAELVSIGALLQLLLSRANEAAEAKEQDPAREDSEEGELSRTSKEDSNLKLLVMLMDIAQWDSVNKALYGSLTTPPKLSQYASAAVKAANRPFVSPGALRQALFTTDVLTINPEHLERMLSSPVKLVTIFFTLNELYATSRAKTQAFLLELTMSLRPGALLLVVDSAGSYSTVELNGAEKKYPMHWLLDHTLLKVAATPSIAIGEENGQPTTKDKRAREQEYPRWEKLREEESTWFRLSEGLMYPLELEDMRYQLHLYRRLEQQ